MYKIRYLPLALDDLKNIVRYIADTLDSPQAAEKLLSKIDKAVLKIADNPFQSHFFFIPALPKLEY